MFSKSSLLRHRRKRFESLRHGTLCIGESEQALQPMWLVFFKQRRHYSNWSTKVTESLEGGVKQCCCHFAFTYTTHLPVVYTAKQQRCSQNTEKGQQRLVSSSWMESIAWSAWLQSMQEPELSHACVRSRHFQAHPRPRCRGRGKTKGRSEARIRWQAWLIFHYIYIKLFVSIIHDANIAKVDNHAHSACPTRKWILLFVQINIFLT